MAVCPDEDDEDDDGTLLLLLMLVVKGRKNEKGNIKQSCNSVSQSTNQPINEHLHRYNYTYSLVVVGALLCLILIKHPSKSLPSGEQWEPNIRKGVDGVREKVVSLANEYKTQPQEREVS